MKRNSLAMIHKLAYHYKEIQIGMLFSKMVFIILLCFLFIHSNAQEYTRTFTKEIETISTPTIVTNVPTSLSIELNTTNSHRSNTKFGFIIKGNHNKDRLYIHKDFEVHTWDKQIVRQEVSITISSADQNTAQNLMDLLEINFLKNDQGHITIDANMNIMGFSMANKLINKDNCRITLNDGKTFPIEYLELKTSLFIPKKANLKVNSILHHTLKLDDLEGDLDLDIQYGEVFGKKIKNLNANLRFCFNVIFEEADKVIASATNSYLKITKVNELILGETRLRKGPLLSTDRIQWLDNNSSMNLYNFRNVGKLIISDTANDDFKIGEVDRLEINSSIYSNYKVLKLNKELLFNGKNGDLSIAEVNRSFEKIDIQNRLSKLNINIANDGDYMINIYDKDKIESRLPPEAKQINVDTRSQLSYRIGTRQTTGEINIRCDRCDLDIWD